VAASLVLIRHGEIRANRQGRWHGSTNSKLTWLGRRQAKKTARHLQSIQPTISALYSSPLDRCLSTADFFSRKLFLEVQIMDDLAEYALGEWEDMRFTDLAKHHDFFKNSLLNHHYEPPGGESLQAVSMRITQALTTIHDRHDQNERVAVVGHGAAFSVALATLLDDNPSDWTNYDFANCGITELVLQPDSYVDSYNLTNHL
jgi:probable phosphoglycerate mutase